MKKNLLLTLLLLLSSSGNHVMAVESSETAKEQVPEHVFLDDFLSKHKNQESSDIFIELDALDQETRKKIKEQKYSQEKLEHKTGIKKQKVYRITHEHKLEELDKDSENIPDTKKFVEASPEILKVINTPKARKVHGIKLEKIKWLDRKTGELRDFDEELEDITKMMAGLSLSGKEEEKEEVKKQEESPLKSRKVTETKKKSVSGIEKIGKSQKLKEKRTGVKSSKKYLETLANDTGEEEIPEKKSVEVKKNSVFQDIKDLLQKMPEELSQELSEDLANDIKKAFSQFFQATIKPESIDVVNVSNLEAAIKNLHARRVFASNLIEYLRNIITGDTFGSIQGSFNQLMEDKKTESMLTWAIRIVYYQRSDRGGSGSTMEFSLDSNELTGSNGYIVEKAINSVRLKRKGPKIGYRGSKLLEGQCNLSSLHDARLESFLSYGYELLEPFLGFKVESLDLSNNDLKMVPNFDNLPNLQELDLKGNEIKNFPSFSKSIKVKK